MSTIKTFKKGEALFKEGEKVTHVYLIQSGSVQLSLHRQKQNIELAVISSSQIAGEQALSGATTHGHSAIAQAETKAIELPVEGLKAQLEKESQLQKFLVKGLLDKMKVLMRDLQSMKLERDSTPCPPDQTAKIFATVYHVARTKGELAAAPAPGTPASVAAAAPPVGSTVVGWHLMRQYAQHVFLESPKRLEMAVNVFVKLGWASYEMAKPEDDPAAAEEISRVIFKDLAVIEQFFEFFQYYHFKGGKQELLKTDDRAIQMATALVELGAGETADRHGSVRLDYSKIIEKFKSSLGMTLNNDHWSLLEAKGLFVKRQSTDAGVFLQFDLREFERTGKVWKVLREVERWNEKGSVDPNEPVDAKKAEAKGPACGACGMGYTGAPKFCGECGAKISVAA